MQSLFRTLMLMVLLVGFCPRPTRCENDNKFTGPRIVMIIRHAEKSLVATDADFGPDLSKRGYERAAALAKILPEHFPRPDFLIAAKRSKKSNRPVETITPLARALHEDIDTNYENDDFDNLAHQLLIDPKYVGKTILIAWHHGKIPDLAKALGAKNAPDAWDNTVFDRVWKISYENGEIIWKDFPQQALPGDSAK